MTGRCGFSKTDFSSDRQWLFIANVITRDDIGAYTDEKMAFTEEDFNSSRFGLSEDDILIEEKHEFFISIIRDRYRGSSFCFDAIFKF